MNQHDELQQDDLQHQVQLLIDNELNAEQTTAVLQRCEQHPAAWKMMAMGMLESRELKIGLSELLNSTNRLAGVTSQQQPHHTPRWVWHGLVACLAVATFVAGLNVPKERQQDSVAEKQPDSDTNISQPIVSNDTADVALVAKPDSENDTVVKQTGMAVVGYAQILHQVGSEPPIPVITGPDLDCAALLTQQRRIPESIARQYRNEGLVVENQRRVMSLELADGQRFAIPLDLLGVRYVGNELL